LIVGAVLHATGLHDVNRGPVLRVREQGNEQNDDDGESDQRFEEEGIPSAPIDQFPLRGDRAESRRLLILLLVAVRRAPTPHRWGTLPMRISPRARMRSPPRSRFFLLLVVLVLLLFRLVVLVRPDVGGVGHWARLFRTPLNPSFRPAAPRGVERLPLDDTLGSERLSEPRHTTQRRDAVGGGHASVRHFDAPVFRDAVVSGRSRVRFESDSFHGPGGPLQPLRTF